MALKHPKSLCTPGQHLLPSSQAGMQLNQHKCHCSMLHAERKPHTISKPKRSTVSGGQNKGGTPVEIIITQS